MIGLCLLAALAALASPLAPAALAEEAAPPAKSAPAATSGCAVGEETAKVKGAQVCKPIAGACGKGRKRQREQGQILCIDDLNAHAAALTCAENESPHYPANKKVKPFCEPVGTCGFGRVPKESPVKGKRQCVPK